ncbi:glycosyl hydrolase 2 galactose-binding domain-containing protein [Dictyobacter formicarum]|uniref:beta-mannosidase n=1 Tax=Dictyobacter formicarum TaxID=2778368 RepID=A0ABQ3VF12_9CHLR|nr:glycoside hydrolase family 2 TIM barrel-domain containing protein [Dictyobacter formicarum]GHO84762.1 hypothetical protein KSZ_27680 [Dictyobacter formicarum]
MRTYNLQQLPWTLTGWSPFEWRLPRSGDIATGHDAQIPPIRASVPGSVQKALLEASIIPDWNVGLQARECEWMENRHWVFTTHIPSQWLTGKHVRLRALGLDHAGWVIVNGQEVATFSNAFVPHIFDLSEHITACAAAGDDVTLHIVFDCPARWLGQFGYTSQMTSWEPRFNYTWDWTSRMVQIAVWDDLLLEVVDDYEIISFQCQTQVNSAHAFEKLSGEGLLQIQGEARGSEEAHIEIFLTQLLEEGKEADNALVRQGRYSLREFATGITWSDLNVEYWWPNGSGKQPLYEMKVELRDADGDLQAQTTRRIGFKAVTWQACEGAPQEADPWICVVNGNPIFLQGVNWTPIRTNFADVAVDEYQLRLERYCDMGCNLLRVWGGAYLEKTCFYDLCDELGLLVWQELPLSSSGVENRPPEDPASVQILSTIARSYIERRRHHVSLLLWSGGNEIQEYPGSGRPISTTTSALMATLQQIVATSDPGRRFLPSSPSGPRFDAREDEMGQGLHWDIHGPWTASGDLLQEWTRYWQKDDALLRSEVGAPGASSTGMIMTYAGKEEVMPANWDNALWRRTGWWIEWPRFLEEHDREPYDLDEYVQWSQQRQAEALSIVARACKSRFPRCGGLLIWMGHDAFPCTANTSLFDFHGEPKLAARALREIFHADAPL